AQINRSPHPPGYESREIDAQDICHSSTPPNCCQLTDGGEREWLKIPTAKSRNQIFRQCFPLAEGVLRCWWMIFSGFAVRHQRTVAQRPPSVVAWYSQRSIDFQPATLFHAWK